MEKSLCGKEEIFAGRGFSRAERLANWTAPRGFGKTNLVVIPSAARDLLFRKCREKADSSS